MVRLEKHGIFGALNCIYEKNISPKAEERWSRAYNRPIYFGK